MLTVAIIGAGNVAQRHADACAANPETRLCAVADLMEQRAAEMATPLGAAVYTDYMAMLDAQKPDIAIINLPHWLHEQASVACAQRGIHVFLEKPMSVSYESCLRINEACRENGVLIQVGHPQRYLHNNWKLREIVESGELGRLIAVNEIRAVNYFVDSRPRWFLKKEQSGGGIWMNFGAHSLDKLCSITGSRVKAVKGFCTYERNSDQIDVEGSAQALVEMENGVTGNITLCGYNVAPREELALFFTNGCAYSGRGGITVTQDGVTRNVEALGYPEAFQYQFDEFVQSVKNGKILHNDGEYGADIIRHITSVYEK